MNGTRRLPAEWETQRAVMLTWPHANGDWANHLEEIEATFLAIARAVLPRQRLIVACHDQDCAARLRRTLGSHGDLAVYCVPSNDIWVRDHGPITVLDAAATPRLLDFRFNGWGGKYPFDLDDALSGRLHAQGAFGDLLLEPLSHVLEGGSIDSDGDGTLLTTSRCLLSPTRNPGTDRAWWETRFAEWFGTRRVLWLDHGVLEGDDTDGHVDMLARFVARDTIVYTACDDPTDSHHESLAALADQLGSLRQDSGAPYRLIPLPWPRPRHDEHGNRMPLSYANFLPINGAVLAPVYGQDTDDQATALLGGLFPERDIIPVPAIPLVRQHGSVHCATQQIIQ